MTPSTKNYRFIVASSYALALRTQEDYRAEGYFAQHYWEDSEGTWKVFVSTPPADRLQLKCESFVRGDAD